MTQFAIILNPAKLANPDLDIRYVLPDLIASRSNKTIRPDGFDYVGPHKHMALFLNVDDKTIGMSFISDILGREIVIGNSLLDASVAAYNEEGTWHVFHPENYSGPIHL